MADAGDSAAIEGSGPAPLGAVLADSGAEAGVGQTLAVIFAMLCYQGFTMAINGIGAPWIAKSFNLSQSGIAALYAWISLSAIGALILSRMADRVGRRRVLVWCMGATPLCALAAALSVSMPLFIGFEILLYAFILATVTSAVVVLAEALPTARRASGQSLGGLAIGLGGGLCVILMPLLDRNGYSWRWLLVLSAAGLLGFPFIVGRIPESQRWERASASGATRSSSLYDVFGVRHRRRALPILACFLCNNIAFPAVTSWPYFHAVSVVGLSAGSASIMMLIGGGLSMLGFPLGAWACERLGRVPTVVGAAIMVAAGSLVFYWGPPARWELPGLWLGSGFCWFLMAVNACTVAGNSAVTELFPTVLRGTIIGWFALIGALGSVSAEAMIALLAQPLGGLSVVVGYLGLLMLPSALIWGMFVEETRGLSLEVSARETV
jgi:putative MFS transporter